MIYEGEESVCMFVYVDVDLYKNVNMIYSEETQIWIELIGKQLLSK